MSKLLFNEKGYSLFLTIFIMILFSVLSIMMLSLVVSGAKKNVIREEYTQADELSQKGIEHITNQIQKELEDVIGENGISKTHFIDEMERILNEYLCENNDASPIQESNLTGDYAVCIDDWEDSEGEYGDLRKKVTFLSTGMVDGKETSIKTTMLIGANDVPDALNYAVGSHRSCSGNDCIDGEGNLFLHGGVSIEGDIKVDGHLITTDRGYAYLSGEQWINSLYPSALPGPNTNESRLVLGGDVYTFSHKPSYSEHIKRNSFPSSSYQKISNLEEAFETAPVIVSREPKRNVIEISEQADNFKYGFNDPGVVKIKGQTIENQNYSSKKVFPYYTRSYPCGLLGWRTCHEDTTYGTYTLTGDNTFGQFATNGNVEIRNSSRNHFATTTIEHGMYVNGDLEIGDTGIRDSNYNPNTYEKIRVSGPIYVNGDLIIKGADAEFNALIYVNGDVTIMNTRINGMHVDGREGSLIVFANGSIHIANNSVNLDEPSNIRGFFYSEEALEMFGVGSNIRIEGGISARRIVLNAIRGRAKSYSFDGSQRITSSDYFEGVAGQRSRPSRLQIIYNPEIINTYSDLKEQEPIITNLDPPELIDRKNES